MARENLVDGIIAGRHVVRRVGDNITVDGMKYRSIGVERSHNGTDRLISINYAAPENSLAHLPRSITLAWAPIDRYTVTEPDRWYSMQAIDFNRPDWIDYDFKMFAWTNPDFGPIYYVHMRDGREIIVRDNLERGLVELAIKQYYVFIEEFRKAKFENFDLADDMYKQRDAVISEIEEISDLDVLVRLANADAYHLTYDGWDLICSCPQSNISNYLHYNTYFRVTGRNP